MVGTADWSIAVGFLAYFVALIVAIIYFLRFRKFFPIAFIASITTYIFAVFYAWDVFEFNKNFVLLVLAISTGLMFFLGSYFSKIELKPSKAHTSLKERK